MAAQFNPGNIIDDAVFYDGGALAAAGVQAFLNSKVSACRAGYVCLKDYRQSTASKPGEAGAVRAVPGAANETAAQIIYKVGGAACGISQKALIVLLEKEQSLVTDDWPVDRQYRSATGYGCPDTADCDAQFYGFHNQVWMAALQFKRYAANPGGWNHIAGRVNAIRYNPNAACGSSQVFIQNTATAGLYNYTPYQPNAAALANLYGTGGFVQRLWKPQLLADLHRLVRFHDGVEPPENREQRHGVRHRRRHQICARVDDNARGVRGARRSLHRVRFLPRIHSDRQNAGRVIRAPNGSIYFIDASIKLPFSTCAEVEDYGGSCDPSGFVQLTGPQIDRFHTGPAITPVLGTVEGSRYYIKGGVKREILDDASQTAAGIPLGHNVLTENAVAKLALGDPIVRDSVFVRTRGNFDGFPPRRRVEARGRARRSGCRRRRGEGSRIIECGKRRTDSGGTAVLRLRIESRHRSSPGVGGDAHEPRRELSHRYRRAGCRLRRIRRRVSGRRSAQRGIVREIGSECDGVRRHARQHQTDRVLGRASSAERRSGVSEDPHSAADTPPLRSLKGGRSRSQPEVSTGRRRARLCISSTE